MMKELKANSTSDVQLLRIRQLPKTRRRGSRQGASFLESFTGAFVAPLGRVTMKIEIMPGEEGNIIKLIGRLRAEYLPELKGRIETSGGRTALDMDEVTLVDVESVRFLSTCETQGVELRRCPAYIREWITRERDRRC
jgi:hypothetical protein